MTRITQIIIVLAAASAAWGQNTFPQSGNVGIGTMSPDAPLALVPSSNGTVIHVGNGAFISAFNGDASFASSAFLAAAGVWTAKGYGSAQVYASQSGYLAFSTNASLTFGNTFAPTERMRIDTAGNVGIGTTSPSYTLDVKGSIGATDIYVASNALPDYVFDAGYRNAPLSEVAAYIEQNHHLPGMPSAADAEKNRLSVADMQNKLLQKVEELTLHMIAAERRNTELEQEVRKLQAQLQSVARVSEAQDRGEKK